METWMRVIRSAWICGKRRWVVVVDASSDDEGVCCIMQMHFRLAFLIPQCQLQTVHPAILGLCPGTELTKRLVQRLEAIELSAWEKSTDEADELALIGAHIDDRTNVQPGQSQ
jgi:hypothetical protein